MRKSLMLVLLMASTHLFAQTADDDKNITISEAKRSFVFVKGDKENPVQIKEEISKTFTCNNYRTAVNIAEFYNDKETIDDVKIYVDEKSKGVGVYPKYDYYNSDGIFYSDARVCFFNLPLLKKGTTSQVVFKKTTLDPHYFTNIFFSENELIQSGEVSIKVPAWMELEIKEFNFAKFNIKKEITQDGDAKVYTYRMTDLPAIGNEKSAPGPTYFAPHLLVLCKSAQPKDEKYTYFSTLKEQYGWYRSLVGAIGNEPKTIAEKTEEITKGIADEEGKVKAVYQWVQDNVRYIAFENGIAGFKPEKAQEVLRKKYGDCKGMANLLTEMLRSIKLDARLCWLGTKHIAYDYSTPSLSVDNHMICAWMKKGKPVFLDATEKYIGLGETAERIQGRQILIENGDKYLLEKVPSATHVQNIATEFRTLKVEGNNLTGHIKQVWKGENKEWLLSSLSEIKQDKQEKALTQYLAEGKQNFIISNLKINNISNYNADLNVEYDVLWKDVLTVFDQDTYLDADNRRNFDNFKIDEAKRKLPYWFEFKNDMVFETEIVVPEGKMVNSMPEKLSIKQPGYSFNASYTNTAGKILYKNEIIINQAELRTENFAQWNKDIDQLTNFYNQQIVFTQKK